MEKEVASATEVEDLISSWKYVDLWVMHLAFILGFGWRYRRRATRDAGFLRCGRSACLVPNHNTDRRSLAFAGTSYNGHVTCTKRSAQPNIVSCLLVPVKLTDFDVMIATEDASGSKRETRY